MIPPLLLPAELREEAFIAGGYAACPALAQDVDVWIPSTHSLFKITRVSVLDHLHRVANAHAPLPGDLSFTVQDDDDSPRGRLLESDAPPPGVCQLNTFEDYNSILRLRRAATVNIVGHTLPYHIIIVEGAVDDVLSSFDISTHQVALTWKGVVRGEHWTPPNAPPVVITQKYTTTERLAKIEARYACGR